MVCVVSVRRVMWLPASRTWLSEGAKDLIFLKTVKNRGVFCEFYAWFFMNPWFISWSTSIFSHYHACVSKRLRLHPLLAIWIEHSDWSIFEFLVRDFPKTSCTGHIACLILFSLPLLSTLGLSMRLRAVRGYSSIPFGYAWPLSLSPVQICDTSILWYIKSTLTRVCNLYNSSIDGVFHEWHSSWLPCGANMFLCKLRCWARVQLHRFRYFPCGTIVYVKTH